MINWQNEVEKRKDDLIRDTQEFLRIRSVLDDNNALEGAPFGLGIKEALEYALDKCEFFDMKVKNIDGYAGHAEIGEGEEIIGILCHVDVVPEGKGWTYPPYEAKIIDGKIYARGSVDDKGPSMSAIYALKILKDLDVKLNKRVRIIFGTDEESHWRGIKYYFEKEEMPTIGFSPDADFPIIVAEKGIGNVTLTSANKDTNYENQKANVVSFLAGERTNVVPDLAIVKIQGATELLNKINDEFNIFLESYKLGGDIKINNEELIIQLKGKSAHAMEPFEGVNAGLELLKFLTTIEGLLNIDDWIEWTVKFFCQEYYGKKLEIDYEDDISGVLTVNAGIIKYEDNKISIDINIRYPVTNDFEDTVNKIKEKALLARLDIKEVTDSKPHHVDKDHFLIKTLKKVYEEQTGNEATLLSMGGGTYARALDVAVAFGPTFPGKEAFIHQRDEYIEIDDFLKATAIYAQAIYELAK